MIDILERGAPGGTVLRMAAGEKSKMSIRL
jgi:hypothetical protein